MKTSNICMISLRYWCDRGAPCGRLDCSLRDLPVPAHGEISKNIQCGFTVYVIILWIFELNQKLIPLFHVQPSQVSENYNIGACMWKPIKTITCLCCQRISSSSSKYICQIPSNSYSNSLLIPHGRFCGPFWSKIWSSWFYIFMCNFIKSTKYNEFVTYE